MRIGERLRSRRRGRLSVAIALAVVCAALLLQASAALATVSGKFCNELWLPSGASCHSQSYHSIFDDLEGISNRDQATCVGIDTSPQGGTLVHQCSEHAVICFSACDGYSGYAYVHNHARVGDYYQGFLVAAS
jgi:hypothetical protein